MTRAVIVATDPGSDRDHWRNLRDAGLHQRLPVDIIPATGRTDWPALRTAIDPSPGTLVVVDTLTGVTDGELINGPAVTATMDEIADLAAEGGSVVVVHHESTSPGFKGGRSRRPMGHTAIEAMPRWHLRMEARSGGWTLTAEGNSAAGEIYTLRPGRHIADFVVSSSEPTAKRDHNRDAAKKAAHKAMAEFALNSPDLRSATQAEMSRALVKQFPEYSDAKRPDRAIAGDLSEGRGVGRFLRLQDGAWTGRTDE